jgi:type IV pilus assembly protein PilE
MTPNRPSKFHFGTTHSLAKVSSSQNTPSSASQHAGYSLLEAIISVIILGIVISVAIPNFTVTIEKTRASEGVKILSEVLTAQRAFFAEHQAYATDWADLDITITNPENFNNLDDTSVDNDPTAVAVVQRSNGAYTLSIDEDGDITCNDGGGTICAQLAY